MEKLLKRDFIKAIESDKSIMTWLYKEVVTKDHEEAKNKLSRLVNMPVRFIEVRIDSIKKL